MLTSWFIRLLGRTDSPMLGGAAQVWETGTPLAQGWYAVRLTFLDKPLDAPRCFYYDGDCWGRNDDHGFRPLDRACKVTGWIRLPEEVEA